MGYPILPSVYESGIAETGLTCVVNDRNTQLKVPWEASQTGSKNIEWLVTSDNGQQYKITVPVVIAVSNGATTVTYNKGTYTRAVVS